MKRYSISLKKAKNMQTNHSAHKHDNLEEHHHHHDEDDCCGHNHHEEHHHEHHHHDDDDCCGHDHGPGCACEADLLLYHETAGQVHRHPLREGEDYQRAAS